MYTFSSTILQILQIEAQNEITLFETFNNGIVNWRNYSEINSFKVSCQIVLHTNWSIRKIGYKSLKCHFLPIPDSISVRYISKFVISEFFINGTFYQVLVKVVPGTEFFLLYSRYFAIFVFILNKFYSNIPIYTLCPN